MDLGSHIIPIQVFACRIQHVKRGLTVPNFAVLSANSISSSDITVCRGDPSHTGNPRLLTTIEPQIFVAKWDSC